jgi:hypothetical protein
MRAYFPLDPDDKENRFQRVMHFLRDSRPTMRALDDFIVRGHAEGGLSRPDGLPEGATLGGIRVLSLRLPIPEPGDTLTRTTRRPLSEYPKSVRKNFYHTPDSKRAERCGYREPVKPPQDTPVEPAEIEPPAPRTQPSDTELPE